MLDARTLGEIGAGLTGLTGAGTLLRRYVIRPVIRGVRGLIEMNDRTHKILKEFQPNGGNTLSDKIATLQATAIDTNQLVQITSGRVDRVLDFIEQPVFECDALGKMVRPNEAFCKLVGRPPAELLGNGWIGLIATTDRQRTIDEIKWASRDRRAFRLRVTIETAAGARLLILMLAQPKLEATTGNVLAYFGAAQVLQTLDPAKAS